MFVSFRGLLFVSITGAFITGCGSKTQGPPPMQAFPVQVQTVTLSKVNDYTEYVGTIQSRGASVVQPLVEGYLEKIFVHSGQHVRAGEPLMLIDPAKQQATVTNSQATTQSKKAQLDLARVQLARVKQLFADGVVAKQELDNAQGAYDSAAADLNALQANVKEQSTQLRYYTIKAGTAGTVGDIPVRVGDHVIVSTLLTTLDTGGGLEDYISIPTERAQEVKLGTPVQIVADDGTTVDTKVTFVSPRVDSASQLVLVKAAIPASDKRVRNLQVVHTRIIWKQIQAPLVPVLDVSRQSSQIFAFVVGNKDGKDFAEQRALKTSGMQGNDYIVQDGLKPGDQLIVSGVQLLANGMPVKPLPPAAGAPQPAAGNAGTAASGSAPLEAKKAGTDNTQKGSTDAQGSR